ncbi:hypothetical protein GCM10022198_14240 [Klugiella xanthotipulae]
MLTELADGLVTLYPHGRITMAVDGGPGVPVGEFADDLATLLRYRGHTVFRAHLDDFHAPAQRRHLRGRYSAEGYLDFSFDESLLRRVLVEPFRLGGSTGFQLAGFDLARNQPYEARWVTAPEDAILIVDGSVLLLPSLRGLWHGSVWLDAPQNSDAAEAISLAPVSYAPVAVPEVSAGVRRNAEANTLYRERVLPGQTAQSAIDISDPAHPRRVLSDFC